jgi:hypothetical protein
MATMTHTVGSVTAFSLDSNIDSLADGTAKPLGTEDCTDCVTVTNSSEQYPVTTRALFIVGPRSGE